MNLVDDCRSGGPVLRICRKIVVFRSVSKEGVEDCRCGGQILRNVWKMVGLEVRS